LREEQIFLFGKLTSRWPVRGGVLVKDGVVYGVAGWDVYDGLVSFGLDAYTGETVWRHAGTRMKHKAGYDGVPTAFADLVILPKAGEARRARDGKQVPMDVRYRHFTAGDWLVTGTYPWEGFWRRSKALQGADLVFSRGTDPRSAAFRLRDLRFRQFLFDGTTVYGLWRERGVSSLVAVRLTEFLKAAEKGIGAKWGGVPMSKVERLWQLPVKAESVTSPGAMIKAGGTLVSCRGHNLLFVRASDGKELHELTTRAPVVPDGLAAAHGYLVVTTSRGGIECYAAQE